MRRHAFLLGGLAVAAGVSLALTGKMQAADCSPFDLKCGTTLYQLWEWTDFNKGRCWNTSCGGFASTCCTIESSKVEG